MKKAIVLGLATVVAALFIVGCGATAEENSQKPVEPEKTGEVNTNLKGGEEGGAKPSTQPVSSQ